MSETFSLRKFPFPYSAALSIANDLDNMNWDDFIEVRKFLNTDMETSMGSGLNMQIGESFWCYSLLPYEVTYFKGLTARQSPYAPVLLEMIKAGYLDCFHSYGNFSRWENPGNPTYFKRELAENAINEMTRFNIKFGTYVNHGDSFNRQNILAQLRDNRGDIPGQESYHTDMTIDELGIKFYWASDLTAVIGQDRNLRYDDFSYYCFKVNHLLKGIAKTALSMSHRKRKVFGNELLREVRLRDNRVLMEFPRYCHSYSRIYNPPGRPVLVKQLSDKVLNRLEKFGGYMIIYTHLGQPIKRTSPQIFDDELVGRFRSLKKRSVNGTLWVTTTSRLLEYCYIRRFLKWTAEIKNTGEHAINIKGVDGPVKTRPSFQGLTFYCPEPAKTNIYINNHKVEPVVINPPDSNKLSSITIPVESLQFPTDIF